jgi:hypothetical protein
MDQSCKRCVGAATQYTDSSVKQSNAKRSKLSCLLRRNISPSSESKNKECKKKIPKEIGDVLGIFSYEFLTNAHTYSASNRNEYQESILWNPKFHYSVHNTGPYPQPDQSSPYHPILTL